MEIKVLKSGKKQILKDPLNDRKSNICILYFCKKSFNFILNYKFVSFMLLN